MKLLGLPTKIEKGPKTLKIYCAKDHKLIQELRSMVGSKFMGDHWQVSDCRRNWIALEVLQGLTPKEFEPYFRTPEPMGFQRPLMAHQRDMVGFALAAKRVILAADMGTGKTLAAVEVMERASGRWAYVAPANVLPAIQREIAKWKSSATPDLMSYEAMVSRAEKGLPDYRGVVLDEATKIKTPDAKRSQVAKYVADNCEYVLIMTGTPAPKDPTDWWHLAEVCCPGWLRESSVTKLRNRLAIIQEQTINGLKFPLVVGWKQDEVERLGGRLRRLAKVYSASDCLDLPELRHEALDLGHGEAMSRAMHEIIESSVSGIEALERLRQLSDGFSYLNDLEVPTPKDDALRGILEQSTDGRIVIFAPYQASVERCKRICLEQEWDVLTVTGAGMSGPVDEALREMDASTSSGEGKYAVVANPQSGGYGLTFNAACREVFFSNSFHGEARMQAEKRIHRHGQKRACVVYDLLHLPVDRLVLDNLRQKRDLQQITLDEIKAAL